MRHTDHVLLVGEGALRFARAHGFPEVKLLTEAGEQGNWQAHQTLGNIYVDGNGVPADPAAAGPAAGGPPAPHAPVDAARRDPPLFRSIDETRRNSCHAVLACGLLPSAADPGHRRSHPTVLA